jgi:hypothetical protein
VDRSGFLRLLGPGQVTLQDLALGLDRLVHSGKALQGDLKMASKTSETQPLLFSATSTEVLGNTPRGFR